MFNKVITVFCLENDIHSMYRNDDERESCGFGDGYMELQQVSMPKIDHRLVGKKIKMLFEMIEPNDECVLQLCEENVIAVSKSNNNVVSVCWNEQHITDGDSKISNVKLMPSK